MEENLEVGNTSRKKQSTGSILKISQSTIDNLLSSKLLPLKGFLTIFSDMCSDINDL